MDRDVEEPQMGSGGVYDFFGPSSFFPMSEPDIWRERCGTDGAITTYLGVSRPAPAPVWTRFGHWGWPCRIHNLVTRKASR